MRTKDLQIKILIFMSETTYLDSRRMAKKN